MSRDLDRRPASILALKWLVLLKLDAGRVQDLADVTRMMGCASDLDIPVPQAVVAQWLPDAPKIWIS